jgi:cytochrome d ubiquinol oxidase subunit II
VASRAATNAVLSAMLVSLGVGALLLVPSLWWLYRTVQQAEPRPADPLSPTAGNRHPRSQGI